MLLTQIAAPSLQTVTMQSHEPGDLHSHYKRMVSACSCDPPDKSGHLTFWALKVDEI
jgi:hypothetical protein